MIKTSSLIFVLLGTATIVTGSGESVSYKYQGQDWPGTCATGIKQSPIDIPKGEFDFFNTSTLYNTFLNTPSIIGGNQAASKHRLLQNNAAPTSISTSCTLSKTGETSTINGFCCASLNRNNTLAVIQVLAPVHFHNHSFTISSVEYSFNCNFLGTVSKLKTCSSASTFCGNANTTCCARANNYFRTAAGVVVARDNFPADGYCMDIASTGNITLARYSAPATTGLDSDGVVETKCIETPKFKGIDTLSFFAT